MKASAWETCQYYSAGQCPQHRVIDKAYLIPQLLDDSQIQAAEQICENCEKPLADRRQYQRVKRPLRVAITHKDSRERISGTLVDVSINGALVNLDHWVDFQQDELVELHLYNEDSGSYQQRADTTSLSGKVNRVAKEKLELAVIFLKPNDVKKCANI